MHVHSICLKRVSSIYKIRNIGLSLKAAKIYSWISKEQINIIKRWDKTILFHREVVLIKNVYDGLFDIFMGSLDSAEICKLMGIALLSELNNIVDNHNSGLNRDNNNSSEKIKWKENKH